MNNLYWSLLEPTKANKIRAINIWIWKLFFEKNSQNTLITIRICISSRPSDHCILTDFIYMFNPKIQSSKYFAIKGCILGKSLTLSNLISQAFLTCCSVSWKWGLQIYSWLQLRMFSKTPNTALQFSLSRILIEYFCWHKSTKSVLECVPGKTSIEKLISTRVD